MSNTQCTPGPWMVAEGSGTIVITADRVPAIAATIGDEAKENAMMIAASHDMFDALEQAERMIDEALPKFNWAASALDANAIHLLNDTPRVIKAALTKARGQS